MKQAVVDVDNSLLHAGRLSWLFWRLAAIAQRAGRRRQRVDRDLVRKLTEYDRVILLTSRDLNDKEFTLAQLRRAGFEPEQAIFCPRREVLMSWKVAQVASLSSDSPTDWFDDRFNGHPDPEFEGTARVRIIRTGTLASVSRSEGEPDHL